MSRLADCRDESAAERGPERLSRRRFPDRVGFFSLPSAESLREQSPWRKPLADGESSDHTERSETSGLADVSHNTRPVRDTSPAIAGSAPAAAATQQAVDARRPSSDSFARRAFPASWVCRDSSPLRSPEYGCQENIGPVMPATLPSAFDGELDWKGVPRTLN